MSAQQRSLLLVAHGSRRSESNEEVRRLTEAMRRRASGRFITVECAFLELAEPSIPDGIEASIQQGAKEVIVLPYFLSAGRHVAKDIPEEVAGKQREHPDIKITIAPYLGSSDDIPDLLLSLVN
jgi:sirohydrochlorin ferrochelatase